MKVGDLVIMPDSSHGHYDAPAIGVVVKMPFVGPNGQNPPRAGIYWMDGDGHVDWELMNWLEVVSEAQTNVSLRPFGSKIS